MVVFHKLRIGGGELRHKRVHLIVQRGIGGIKLIRQLLGGRRTGGHGVTRFGQARGVGVNLGLQVCELGGGHAIGRKVGQVRSRGGMDVARGVGGSGVASAGHVAGGHGALRGEVVIFDLLGVGVDRKGDDGGGGRHVFAELLFVGSKARGIHGLILREGLNVRDVRRELRIAIGKRGKRLDGRCVAVAYSLDRKKH